MSDDLLGERVLAAAKDAMPFPVTDAEFRRLTLAVLAVVQPELDRLERWKAEATEVILDLQELGKALGLGLGERITGQVAREAAERLAAERDEARAALARVRLIHRPDGGSGGPGAMCVECTPEFGTEFVAQERSYLPRT